LIKNIFRVGEPGEDFAEKAGIADQYKKSITMEGCPAH